MCLTLLAAMIVSLSAFASEPQGKLAGHVVFIGLDGWASEAFEKSDMPFVKSKMNEGSYTLEKRSVLPSSSAVNWSSIFMGAGPEITGYLQWGSRTPELVQPTGAAATNGIFPTIFQINRQQNPSDNMALFAEWDGVKHLVDTLSLDCQMLFPYTELSERSGEYIKANKPEIIAVVFDRPDHPGHDNGWGSPEYHDMMHVLDAYVAQIEKAVEEAGILDDTVFILTADHGGKGYQHGGTSMSEMQSPLFIWGKNVKKGNKIEDMVISYDIAPTMAYILGLDTPGYWRGQPVKSAFSK